MSAEALRWGRWQNVEGATQGPCGWSHTGAWCASGGGREAVVRLTAQPPCACAFLPEGRKWALGGLVSPQLVGCGVGAGFTGGGRIQGQCISLFTRESRCCPNFTPPLPVRHLRALWGRDGLGAQTVRGLMIAWAAQAAELGLLASQLGAAAAVTASGMHGRLPRQGSEYSALQLLD